MIVEQNENTVKINEFVSGELYIIETYFDRKAQKLVGRFIEFDENDSGFCDDAEGMLVFHILGKMMNDGTHIKHINKDTKMMECKGWNHSKKELRFEVMRVGDDFWFEKVRKIDSTYFKTRPLIEKTILPDDMTYIIDSFLY